MAFFRTHIAAALVAAAAGVAAMPADATPLSRILARSGFTPEDFNIMRAAEASLLNAGSLKAGATAQWSNPKSEAHGHAKLTGVKGACADTELVGYLKDSEEAHSVRRSFCRNAEGKWLLQP